METTTRKRIIAGLAAIVMCGTMTPAAVAATPGTSSGTTACTSQLNNTTNKQEVSDAKIQLEVTSNKWRDPDDGHQTHENGTYQVVVPTKISWSGLSVGEVVDKSDSTSPKTTGTDTSYDVTVRGNIPDNQKVVLNAVEDATLTAGSETLTAKTTLGKKEWTQAEAGVVDSDGYVAGTSTSSTNSNQHSVYIEGTVKTRNTYTGNSVYSASLEDVS